jgi:putative two-component system response regulator
METKSYSSNVMVVDDAPSNLAIVEAILGREGYRVRPFMDGAEALAEALADPPDVVLLDIGMPGMDGYEVCEHFRSSEDLCEVPIIFISGRNDTIDKVRGFDVGGVDYVTKPFNTQEVVARVNTHLELRHARVALKGQNELLAERVRERTKEIVATQDVMIHGLALLAEYRDNETGTHIIRTQRYVEILATRLKEHPRFRPVMTSAGIERIIKSAPLHDIGKVALPDSILHKPGKLTPEEFEQMKLHTICGRDALRRAEEDLGLQASDSFLQVARQMTIAHHERWDGSGYPFGLEGEAIPIPARIMAISDVYDALVTKRVYKPAMTHEEAVRIITVGDGRVESQHFDPAVLEAFINAQDELHETMLSLPE